MSLIVALLLLLPEHAHANELVWEGYYRARGLYLNSLSLADTDGNENASGATFGMDHRFSLRPTWLLSEHATLHAQLDLVPFTVWGDTPDTYEDPATGATIANADANGVIATGPQLTALRAWGEAHTPVGTFAAGRMPMQWGSGILWNDGNDPLAEYGDSADRFQYTNIFGPVSLMAAFDVQYEGFLNAQDDMQSLNLALAYKGEAATAGLLNTFRYQPAYGWQEYTGDVYGYSELGPLTLQLEAIARLGGGSTETGANDVSETSFGALLNAKLHKGKLGLEVEGGFASGDDNPDDNEIHTFSFNRDHNLGLFLFEEALPTLNASVGTTANGGVDTSAAQSGEGVSNALYIRPQISYAVLPTLQANVSWLAATHAKPDADAATRSGYGSELDLSVRYDPYPHIWVMGTGAVFLPGKFYTDYTDANLGGGFDRTALGARVVGTVEF